MQPSSNTLVFDRATHSREGLEEALLALFEEGIVRDWEYRDHPTREDSYIVVFGSHVDARDVKASLYLFFGVQ